VGQALVVILVLGAEGVCVDAVGDDGDLVAQVEQAGGEVLVGDGDEVSGVRDGLAQAGEPVRRMNPFLPGRVGEELDVLVVEVGGLGQAECFGGAVRIVAVQEAGQVRDVRVRRQRPPPCQYRRSLCTKSWAASVRRSISSSTGTFEADAHIARSARCTRSPGAGRCQPRRAQRLGRRRFARPWTCSWALTVTR
jgi:hypothetical protein